MAGNKFIIAILYVFYFTSCTNVQKEIKVDDSIIRGNIVITKNDTILEGPIQYYDLNNKLLEMSEFHENKKYGKSTTYYSNGKIQDITTYKNGYRNGVNTIYDSSGKIINKKNWHNDIQVGSVEYYQNDSLRTYGFKNFEGVPIYRAEYDKLKGLIEAGSLLNYVCDYSDSDNDKGLKIFIFIIEPPGKELTYKIFDTDINSKDTILIKSIKKTNDQEFATVYLDMPKEGHKYFFNIEAFYSGNGITIRNILEPEACDLVMPSHY